jgi:hypothetical protein
MIASYLDTLQLPPGDAEHIEAHCGEHCVDWEGLIPTHDITRYPAAATVCFNKVV